MKRRRSLTWRVLVILAAAAVVPTVIVGALAIMRARADLEREVVRGNLALVRAVGAQLDGTLQDARRAVELTASAWADTHEDAGATQRHLRRLRTQVPVVSSLTIVDPDGRHLVGDPLPAGVDTGAHSFGGYIGDVQRTGGRSVVHVVVQARSRTGELVAVFVAELDLGFVAETLAQVRLGRGALLYLVDAAGVPVARSDGAPPGGASWRGRPAVDRALGAAVEGHLSADGTVAVFRSLASYQSRRGVPWALVLEQRERDAYALAEETTRDTVIAGTAALALALMIGSILAARLTRPLTALAERADAIARADHPARAAPIEGPGEVGVLAQRLEEMARRIAERHELQAALARGDRLATVGVMSASVAHEINNPLTTVLGYARLLLEDKPEDHPDRAGLELIGAEAERMKSIVSGLLDYARVEKETRGPTDLSRLLDHCGALVQPTLRRAHCRLTVEVPDDLPEVAADAHALQQVLVNLLQNAAQAMQPAGGAVTARASRGPGDLTVEVDVIDEGPGVSAEERARIFDPFYTTKAAGVGTGLGLAVCKHLVSTFGGSLTVGDGPGGRGARFRVVIPRAQ